MMINGSLLLSIPNVKRFRSKKSPVVGQNLTVLGDKKTSMQEPKMTEIYSVGNLDLKFDAKQALACKNS